MAPYNQPLDAVHFPSCYSCIVNTKECFKGIVRASFGPDRKSSQRKRC